MAIESNPASNDTDWIEKKLWDIGGHHKIEFLLSRRIEMAEFKLSINCSTSCWRGNVPNTEEIVLSMRGYENGILAIQVNI